MFRLDFGTTGRYCDGLDRRSFLQLGVAGMAAAGLPQVLRAKEQSSNGKDTSVILIWLDGGPGHLDMYDMKPNAPAEVRSQFQPIGTSVPGLQVCEHLPQVAKLMHKVAVIRSLNHKAGCHNTLPCYTGYEVPVADNTITTPLVLGQTSRMLAAVTLSTFPNTAATGPTPHDRTDAKPVLLRRAMEYMDANATSDIGLADIADAVHVTPRAVQYMFRRYLEITPLQYLRRLRLHYAHQELLAGDRMHNTVTDISARWGFAHTGRFAVLYRQTYGQSPHATLRG